MEKITKKVDGTEKKIKDKKNEIEKTNEDIKKIENEIKELKEEIKVLEERIKEREKMLSSRLQSIQENGGEVKFIEVILGAKNFSELITRSSAVNTVMDSDKAIMEEHLDDQKALETKEEQIKKHEVMLNSIYQSIQKNVGQVKFIEVILSAKNFSELITRSSAVNTVMNSDKSIMEEHLNDQKALETKEEQVKSNKQSLETKKTNQVSEKEKLDELKEKLKGEKEEQAKIKSNIKEEYK